MEIQGNSSCNKEQEQEEEANITENPLAIDIHKENLEKLAKMSEEDILKEKKVLEETLDPKLIEFLRSKKLGKRSVEQNDMARNVLIASKATMDTEMSTNTEINLETDAASVLAARETTDTEVSNNKKMKLLLGNNDDTTMDSKDDEFDIPTSPKKILDEGKQKGWLHMDIPEPEKL